VRPLRPEDEPSLTALFERADGVGEMRYFDPFPLTRATARRLCQEGRRDRFYVAVADDGIVGLSMLRGWDEGYAIPSFGVMIDPSWHGRGLGARMTDYTIDEAWRAGCEAIRLSVYGGNVVAAEMYRRRGFEEIERHAVHRAWGAETRVVMLRRAAGTA
jgi:ribosomal protein S18 acetylase RimI-like enzyme